MAKILGTAFMCKSNQIIVRIFTFFELTISHVVVRFFLFLEGYFSISHRIFN